MTRELMHQGWETAYSTQPKSNFRSQAWEHYTQLGLPTKKKETYRYLKLRKLYLKSYAPSSPSTSFDPSLILPECQNNHAIFINGRLHSSHLPILPFDKALQTYGAFLQNQWKQWIKKESDPFAALNGALHPEAYFLYIPPKTSFDTPFQIIHILDQKQNECTFARLHVFCGSNSQAHCITTLAGDGAINLSTHVSLDENASFTQTSCDTKPFSGQRLEAFRAHLKRDSRLHTFHTTLGSETTRHDYHVTLDGENAHADLQGIAMLQNRNEAHVNVLIEHLAPHCTSNQLFKNILATGGTSSFEGKIYVAQIAQKTEAYQLNANLLLDPHSHAYSKPNLEIFADDVKASHGATFGQLDSEQIFYLRTRGLTEKQARLHLIKGYCQEMIDTITTPSLHKQATQTIDTLWQ